MKHWHALLNSIYFWVSYRIFPPFLTILLLLQPAQPEGTDYVILSVSDNGLRELRLFYRGRHLLETSLAHQRHGQGGVTLTRLSDGRRLVEMAGRSGVMEDCAVKSQRRELRYFREDYFLIPFGDPVFSERDVMDVYLGVTNTSDPRVLSHSSGRATAPSQTSAVTRSVYERNSVSVNSSHGFRESNFSSNPIPSSRNLNLPLTKRWKDSKRSLSQSQHFRRAFIKPFHMCARLSSNMATEHGFLKLFRRQIIDINRGAQRCREFYRLARERLMLAPSLAENVESEEGGHSTSPRVSIAFGKNTNRTVLNTSTGILRRETVFTRQKQSSEKTRDRQRIHFRNHPHHHHHQRQQEQSRQSPSQRPSQHQRGRHRFRHRKGILRHLNIAPLSQTRTELQPDSTPSLHASLPPSPPAPLAQSSNSGRNLSQAQHKHHSAGVQSSATKLLNSEDAHQRSDGSPQRRTFPKSTSQFSTSRHSSGYSSSYQELLDDNAESDGTNKSMNAPTFFQDLAGDDRQTNVSSHAGQPSLHSRVKRDIFSGYLIFPGTKWCGDGDIAESRNDLGALTDVDKCCRRHDRCPMVIPRLTSKFDFYNYRLHTVSHCHCDRKFRRCLERAFSPLAEMIGQVYFNMLGPHCFKLRTSRRCVSSLWWGGCREYGDTTVAYTKRQRKFKTREHRRMEARRKLRKGKYRQARRLLKSLKGWRSHSTGTATGDRTAATLKSLQVPETSSGHLDPDLELLARAAALQQNASESGGFDTVGLKPLVRTVVREEFVSIPTQNSSPEDSPSNSTTEVRTTTSPEGEKVNQNILKVESIPSYTEGESIPKSADGNIIPKSAEGESIPKSADGKIIPKSAEGESIPKSAEREGIPKSGEEESIQIAH